ncbi:MAG: DUF1501 domain-containing protein, partial [Holophagales bacterium]|nr:DUF1501 domain-containing protein [Holophagales bacterium]
FSSLLNLRAAGALAGRQQPIASQGPLPGDEYRALVCLFLAGGNDSFNMLVPRGSAEHAEYAAIRGDLALSAGSLLPISPATSDGREYGVHPGMPEVQQLFDAGQLAFVANVGSLVEPTTKPDILSGIAKLPLGLYSHSDQIMHWQTSLPDQRASLGWAGRTADLLRASNSDNTVSMNISLAGTNVFQTGTQVVSYAIQPAGNGSIGPTGYNGTSPLDQLRTAAINSLLDQHYQNLFMDTFAKSKRSAIDAHLLFSSAVGMVPPLTTSFSDNPVSQSFQMIARTIAARQTLGVRRQTFFLLFGGWDHHDEVLNAQAAMLPVVSKALGEFHAALTEIGALDDVVTFTASDFARTLTSNGQGSDHAWGGNHMVMGGPVMGGDIYGSYPQLFADNDLDTGRGRLLPTASCDEYFADLALWLGVAPSDLATVLPNVERFYSPGSTPPVGFLGGGGPSIFADGFESGNLSAWSSVVG